MFGSTGARTRLVTADQALPGRATAVLPEGFRHRLNGRSLRPPFPAGTETAVFGMGCFWGAERLFWVVDGVWVTGVGYAGGFTPNPTYAEVCSGRTGHAEVVQVVFDPAALPYHELLRRFWEEHDPTQGMRQGNDVGTQYRSLIGVTSPAQRAAAERSRAAYAGRLQEAGHGEVTTELVDSPTVYLAEDHHQQYLVTHPNGYCGLAGTGVSCPTGTGVTPA